MVIPLIIIIGAITCIALGIAIRYANMIDQMEDEHGKDYH